MFRSFVNSLFQNVREKIRSGNNSSIQLHEFYMKKKKKQRVVTKEVKNKKAEIDSSRCFFILDLSFFFFSDTNQSHWLSNLGIEGSYQN